MKWLLDCSKTHYTDIESFDDSALIGGALYILRRHSEIRTLKCNAAVPNDAAPSDRSIEADYYPRMVPILSIFSSISYRMSPNQAQVNTLTQIMGRQPMRWIDPYVYV
jgi:hypothetical protein